MRVVFARCAALVALLATTLSLARTSEAYMSAINPEKARRTQMTTSETTNRIDDASSDFGLDDV